MERNIQLLRADNLVAVERLEEDILQEEHNYLHRCSEIEADLYFVSPLVVLVLVLMHLIQMACSWVAEARQVVDKLDRVFVTLLYLDQSNDREYVCVYFFFFFEPQLGQIDTLRD